MKLDDIQYSGWHQGVPPNETDEFSQITLIFKDDAGKFSYFVIPFVKDMSLREVINGLSDTGMTLRDGPPESKEESEEEAELEDEAEDELNDELEEKVIKEP